MQLRRWIMLVLTVVVVLGSLATSVGYALYIRSERYRHFIADGVGEFLGLPTEIGRVVPLSSRSRGFNDVRIWLPSRRSQVFEADLAVWRNAAAPGEGNRLELHDSWLLIGDNQFSREDYEQLLRSSLGLDFADLDLAAVHFDNGDILWRQPDLEVRVQRTTGEVRFDRDGKGRASLAAHVLNGIAVDEPINISAVFTPGAGLVFHHVALDVPRVPLFALALDAMLDTKITTGWFDGTVNLRESPEGQVISLRGRLGDALLEELTTRVIGGPFSGRANLVLSEAAFTRERILSLAFSGDLDDLRLQEFAPLLGQEKLPGTLDLRVHQVHFRDGHLAHLSAAADAEGLSMSTLTGLIGKGVITGTLDVKVNSILVIDDQVEWADVDLQVLPPEGEVGTIDRGIIREAAERVLGVDLGRLGGLLPEKVEYVRLGAKLLIDGDRLRVEGTHGADRDTILTVKVLGKEWGILKQPDRVFPVADLVEAIRRRAAGYDPDDLLEWWKKKQGRDEEGRSQNDE
jgi:hypothetical protein